MGFAFCEQNVQIKCSKIIDIHVRDPGTAQLSSSCHLCWAHPASWFSPVSSLQPPLLELPLPLILPCPFLCLSHEILLRSPTYIQIPGTCLEIFPDKEINVLI